MTQPNLNEQPVVAKIQARLAAAQAEQPKKPVPTFPHIVYPGKPADIPYDVALYQHLQAAERQAPDFERDLLLSKSPLQSWPLIGPLFQKIRRGLHRIALFYVNRSLKHQFQINRHLLESVGRLTAVTQQQQRTIQALQNELEALKQV